MTMYERMKKWKVRHKSISSLSKEEIKSLEDKLLNDYPELLGSHVYEILLEEEDVQDIIKRAAKNGWHYFRKVQSFGCGCDWTGLNNESRGRATRIPELIELRIKEIHEEVNDRYPE